MAVDLFIDWRDLVYGVPPTAPEKLDVEGAGTDLVVDGSPAEQWVEEQLTEAKEDPRLTPRGDVRAEVLEIMTGGSADEQRASLCVSEAAQFTDMATGEVTSDAPAAIRTYQRFEVAYAREGANWLIESATAGDPQLCVPPSLEAAITKNWEAFTQAWADWERRGAPPDDLGKLTELTTQPLQDVLQAGNGIEPVSPNAQAPATDLRLERATRDRVEGTWCRGEALEGAWELIGNEWLLTYGPTTAPASEVPRC